MTYVWVEIGKAFLNGGNEIADNARIDIRAFGRIDENNAAPHPSEAGFAYNAAAGSGHIWVTMCFEIRRGNPAPTEPSAVVRYSVKTAIAECGFKVIARGNGNGNARIFEDSDIPFFANNNNLSGFMSKLEAVNFRAGDTAGKSCPPAPADGYVTIADIWFDSGSGTWENWTQSAYPGLYKSNPEACIDMFFTTATPPAGFGSNTPRPQYCLGRCSDPPIINTGA